MTPFKVGERVWITDASHRYPWKQDLVGSCGIVDEVGEEYLAVRVNLPGDEQKAPIWFAHDCLAKGEGS